MKSKLFILGLCTACYEQPEQLDPYDVLNATVEQVILPDLDTFKRTAEDLQENSVLFCQDQSQGRLQTLQFSWKGGKKMLKTMELLSFGPYNFGEIDISRRLDNWPERGEGIENLIAGDIYKSLHWVAVLYWPCYVKLVLRLLHPLQWRGG